jgi:hypothetical protein
VHAAPPVRVSLGRSVGWIVFLSLCVGGAVANFSAWVLLHRQASIALALALGLLAAVLTAWRMHGSHSPSELNWNGAEWQWRGMSGQAQVALDLDAWMLLRFDPVQGRRCWIVASRQSVIGPWPALRAALYARRPADPLPAPPP